METLPKIQLNVSNTIYVLPSDGDLVYKYAPFNNLKKQTSEANKDLTSLSISADKSGININEPLELTTEVAYDDSINLIINDRVNPPKLVNSRFYLTSASKYKIADRKGNIDTNVYTEEKFKSETNLIKTVQSIVTVDFLGIHSGGSMPVGNYTFYFKLSDSDGNESDFIAESGKVICHIGNINQPSSIRGGLEDENSGKLIKFRLNNLDLAYDYINVYYSRSTGLDTKNVFFYRLDNKFKINQLNTEISITGFEESSIVNETDINVQYTAFDSVQTVQNCQNISFSGNITNEYELFQQLEKYSLFVTPEISMDESIGNLQNRYLEPYPSVGYEYFNASNVYYKLGYWDEEIYRFGIVYILNDYTLSPVFNIRGIKTLTTQTNFGLDSLNLEDEINIQENFIIQGTDNHNSKGVFKISDDQKQMFSDSGPIRPIGLKFKFENKVIAGTEKTYGLKDLTKGFFIVRQERIPTILAQAVGIGTSDKAHIPVIKATTSSKYNITQSWIAESFLTKHPKTKKPVLQSDIFKVSAVRTNALLCPEATIRSDIFSTYFNSSEYKLSACKYQSPIKTFLDYGDSKGFTLGNLSSYDKTEELTTALLLVQPGTELIRNNDYEFCSKAGDAASQYKHVDPILGNYEDLDTTGDYNMTSSKVRGEFNTFIGCNNWISANTYYNIFIKDYDFKNWSNYFKIRYNDSSPFRAISDRISWDTLLQETILPYKTKACYRGDCYINTVTLRLNWNFTDPEMPTNKRIVDPYTWYKNFKVIEKADTVVTGSDGTVEELSYKKLLKTFTYKTKNIKWAAFPESNDDANDKPILEPGDKKYRKYVEFNGVFGAEKINRPDVNAVGLGLWVTFKICSNVNLSMRDLDPTNPAEEAIHKQKRGFYPLQSMDKNNPLPESTVLNPGISQTLGNKYYFEIPDVPFIKTTFGTRIYYSLPLQNRSFTNGNRIFLKNNYTDYTIEYGALVKLVEWYGTLVAIMEHGVLVIPVKERAMMTNVSGENVYINTDKVLPENPKVLSNSFGSLWPDSVIKTPRYIYGIDTVGKKIWRTNGTNFEIISDLKIQKFLNDNIHLKESDVNKDVGINFIKTHYNAFKQDVLFVFKYGGVDWNLCWNELSGKWVTRYTWFPEFSENINNIFYTFANRTNHPNKGNILYKHGFAGVEEESGIIKPTYWYDTQYPFEYEFVVIGVQGTQTIFNNLKIISNLAEPSSFTYEIVGEGFNWFDQKDQIFTIGSVNSEEELNAAYKQYLLDNPTVTKIPFIWNRDTITPLNLKWPNTVNQNMLRDLSLRKHNKTKENLIVAFQKGADMKHGKDSYGRPYGRLRGNMQYLEDSWDVQIQPITFKYAYLSNGEIAFTNSTEMKIRDKYIKVRIKYDGTKYAIINAIRTLFTISYA